MTTLVNDGIASKHRDVDGISEKDIAPLIAAAVVVAAIDPATTLSHQNNAAIVAIAIGAVDKIVA